jgi:hypothetical protein
MATEAADVEPAACARRAHQAESTCLPVSPSDLSLARCATPCTSPDNHITAETAATADEATTEEAAAEASPLLPSPPAEGGEGVGANSSSPPSTALPRASPSQDHADLFAQEFTAGGLPLL